MRKNQTKKLTPSWYAITIICLLCVGFISNTSQLFISGKYLMYVNYFNLFVTFFWIIFNALLFVYFLIENYERKSLVMPVYFIAINVLNLLNIFVYRWYTNYDVLIYISYVTKIIELSFVTYILRRNWKMKYSRIKVATLK